VELLEKKMSLSQIRMCIYRFQYFQSPYSILYKRVPNRIISKTGFPKIKLPKHVLLKLIAVQTTTNVEEYTVFICICMLKCIRIFKNISYYILNHLGEHPLRQNPPNDAYLQLLTLLRA
jgi:hypothetical protein